MMGRMDARVRGHLVEALLALLVALLLVLGFFAPALWTGNSLAPGDGSISYLPNFYRADPSLWVDDIYAGYAAGLDPQFQRFYPPFWLTSTYPQFVLFAYLAALLGSYGCARCLGASRLGAACAGLIVGFGGFMTAHLGHATIVHAAAWMPWLLWAVHALAQSRSLWPVLGGGVATWLCLGGGHPQISLMGLLLAGLYALSLLPSRPAAERWPFLLRASALFALGLMLAAPILAGLLAASTDSVRGAWSEADFNSFSYTLPELALLGFPNAYGAFAAGPYGAYVGPYNLTELAAYIGWLPWLLVLPLLTSRALWPRLAFWLLCGLGALLLMFGTLSPLGQLVFELPVFGQFRAQARYGIVLCICLAMASALALTALQRGELPLRPLRLAFWLGAVVIVALAGTYAWRQMLQPDDVHSGALRLGLPLVLVCVSLGCLALVVHLRSAVALALLPIVLLADLATFGRFYEWRGAVPLSQFAVSGEAVNMVRAIAESGGRVLPRDDAHGPLTPLTPNANLLHGVPLVTGYGPLADPAFMRIARVSASGGMVMPPADAGILDVLRVGWIAGEDGPGRTHLIGSGCDADAASPAVAFELPQGAQWLRVVSHLSCGVGLRDGTPVARLFDPVVGRHRQLGLLRAGVETAEWAHQRPDVASVVQHARPPHSITFDAGGFKGHWYVADVSLTGTSPAAIGGRTVVLESLSPGSPLRVQSVQYSLEGRSWLEASVRSPDAAHEQHFSEVPRVDGLPLLLRRMRMPPAYWMPCAVDVADEKAMREQLWAGGARRLDVYDTLLVTADAGLAPGRCQGDRGAVVIERGQERIQLRIDQGGTRPLVLATSFHRGWRATANGHPLPIFRAYGLNLGVIVPSGEQELAFEFAPRELRLGFALFALGLSAAFVLLFIALRNSLTVRRNGDLT